MKKIIREIMNKMAVVATGMCLGFTAIGIGFAATPQIGDDAMHQERNENVWEIVEDEAQPEDLEILAEYMDGNILAECMAKEDNSICGILQAYCAYDTAFYDIVCDYFC